MPSAEITKRLLADELRHMLETSSFESVRVSNLCQRCGISKQVFYYHFHSKYDLAAWITQQIFAASVDEATDGLDVNVHTRQLQDIWDNREFYRKVMRDASQNSIVPDIFDFYEKFNEEALRRYLGVRQLNPEHVHAAKLFHYGLNMLIIDWLNGKFEMSPAEFARYDFEHMPPIIRKCYENYRKE